MNMNMNMNIFNALKEAFGYCFLCEYCWWNDSKINSLVNEAVSKGFIRRPSTSQIEWTEKGVKFRNEFKETLICGIEKSEIKKYIVSEPSTLSGQNLFDLKFYQNQLLEKFVWEW